MTRERFALVAIFLNIPLGIAVIILAVLESWGTIKIIAGCIIALLLTSYILFTWPKRGKDGEG